MTKRDKFKGHMIGRLMAQTGCSFEHAELCYAECERRILKPMVALAAGMIVKKVQRDILGVETISRN